jgi:hypothetical protein
LTLLSTKIRLVWYAFPVYNFVDGILLKSIVLCRRKKMVKKRYGLVFALTLAFLLTTVGPSVAVESGRYQAMQISVGKKSEYNIFILDTKEGHMWLLETRESRIDGKLFGGLKSQGKLSPGQKAGDTIFQFGKTE